MRRSLIGKRRSDGPSPFANVEVHLLEPRLDSRHCAVTNVDAIGVIEHFTFADVAREAGRWAHLLRANGLQPGDHVLVLAGREWAWRCALLGVLRAGGVAVPCPSSLPDEEIRAIAASAGAGHLVSIAPRPDLAETDGLAVLDADGIDAIDASRASQEPTHHSQRDDVALVLYARRADGLRGAVHTHASLIAQADAGTHWLGVGEDAPVWCTAAAGSPESIWLLLAGWHEGANIVNVELDLDPEPMLELLGRLGTAAVWFSDEEYARLESAAPGAWINGSINRALVSDERSSGATAFANAVGAKAAAVFGLAELGVVAGWPAGTEGGDTALTARPVPGIELAVFEQGTRLPVGLVGDVVVRGEAPSLVVGYAGSGDGVPQRDGWLRLGWRGALDADGALRLASRSPAELEPVDTEAEAEERRRRDEEEARELVAAAVAAAAAEAERARREAAAAEERRRAEERQRDEERRKAAQEAKRRAEQEAKEREQAEAAARAQREAEERRLAEEEARRRAEQDAREREQAEAAARAEREAEERRRAEEEQRREEKRRREEAEAASAAEREAAAAEERQRAEEAERAALLGSAFLSEVGGSSADAVAAPGEGTRGAEYSEARAGVVEAKPGAAEPAWRHIVEWWRSGPWSDR